MMAQLHDFPPLKSMNQRLDEIERQFAEKGALHTGGGGGTSGGMDDWKASVEDRLGGLRDDVRELRNWLAGGIGFVLLALAGGFFFLLTHVNAASDKADAQLTALREGQVRIETMLAERLPPKK
ncbi:hypothetical protein [Brevundimonas sp. FT23028]|uniref:hypothetical protein n=1 Tax=Brevundimonas sp. FT23028 TaxID=3393748 RepID=UPI003B589855